MATKHTTQVAPRGAQETQANAENRISAQPAESAPAVAPAGKETSINHYAAQGPAPGLYGENVGESAAEKALLAMLETMRPLAQVSPAFRSTIPAALWEMAVAQESAAAAQAQAAQAEKKLVALAQALGLNAQLHGAILAQFAIAQPARAAAIWQAAGLLETLPSGRGRRAKPAPVVPAETLAQYTPENWARACLATGKNAWGLERGTLRHAYCLLVAQHTSTGGISVKAIQHRVGAVRPQNNITREMASAANATATLPARPAFVERVNGLVRATSAGLAAWAAYLALTNGQA